jgi:Asp-tRNA(Asn)/Glu-tRNA(Gln) amidotransferase A subunit family amidase
MIEYPATDYVRQRRRQQPLCSIAATRTARGTHNTRPGNMFGQCGVSLPIPGTMLPVGLQVMRRSGDDAALLSISQGVEEVLGTTGARDMSAFL